MKALIAASMLLLLSPNVVRSEPARVVSVTGQILVDGNPLPSSDQAGLVAVRPGATVKLPRDATLQLLQGNLSVGLLGAARLTLGPGAAGVKVHELQGAVRMAGAGGRLSFQGWQVELASKGAAVLLAGQRLYVLEGSALVRLPPPPVAPAAAVLAWTTTLAAGKAMPLGSAIVAATAGAVPPPRVSRLTASFGDPAPWVPRVVGQVSLEDVKQAQQWMQSERQAQRETASCGCTEGGAQGGHMGGSKVETGNVQANTGVLKVRIHGIPRKAQ